MSPFLHLDQPFGTDFRLTFANPVANTIINARNI